MIGHETLNLPDRDDSGPDRHSGRLIFPIGQNLLDLQSRLQ